MATPEHFYFVNIYPYPLVNLSAVSSLSGTYNIENMGSYYRITDVYPNDEITVSADGYLSQTKTIVYDTDITLIPISLEVSKLSNGIDTYTIRDDVARESISSKQDSSTAVTHTASTAVGSATQPVYIASNGTATATTYTLGKSVPSDAVFTDTTYSAFTGADSSTAGTTGLVPAPASGETGKYLKSNGTWSTITATYDSTTETLTIS